MNKKSFEIETIGSAFGVIARVLNASTRCGIYEASILSVLDKNVKR